MITDDLPMTEGQEPDICSIPARVIAPPHTVSAEARAYLSSPIWTGQWARLDKDDIDGWRNAVAERNQMFVERTKAVLSNADVVVEDRTIAGVTVYVATPRHLAPEQSRLIHMFLHGGGWALMGGEACRAHAVIQAMRLGITTYAVDYRTAPAHRFPVPLDDCVAVYRALLDTYQPQDIVMSGVSAGGNLAAATVLRLRDEGLPLPAAVALLTPCTDGTSASDSLSTLAGIDVLLTPESMADFWAVYAGTHDRSDPFLSPIFADYSGAFPPVLLVTGTRDLLLSDTIRLHRALYEAGASADLHVFEAMPHGGFGGIAPEDEQVAALLRAFFHQHQTGR